MGRELLILLASSAMAVLLAFVLSSEIGECDGAVVVNLGSDITTQETRPSTFTPWVSYTGGSSTLDYVWDLGDASASYQERPSPHLHEAWKLHSHAHRDRRRRHHCTDSMCVEVLNVSPSPTRARPGRCTRARQSSSTHPTAGTRPRTCRC